MSAGLSARHWNKGQLQDLVFFQRGFDITQAQQTPGPYPVISSSGVTSYHNEFKANGPGVVIGRKDIRLCLAAKHERACAIGGVG
jgi:type I restriction enzyme S subunit